MADTDKAQRVRERLERNRARRIAAAKEHAAAWCELQQLLPRARGVGLSVTEAARVAGVSREHVHRVLRERRTDE